jgi:inorganic pyrophosphatase
MEYNEQFWEYLEKLVTTSEILIDRKKGTRHPTYTNMVYEVDYGYLANTKSMDGDGIDIYIGSKKDTGIDAIICTIDLLKMDSEIKILMACTEEEKAKIYNSLNDSEYMKAIMVQKTVE